jgi:hypothetical protein
MKRVYAVYDTALLQYLHGMLADRGIRAMIRNQLLQGAAGELPVNECWPELWVLNDDDYTIARSLVEEAVKPPAAAGAPWRCICGETIDPQFTECWKCGASAEINGVRFD